MYIPYNGAQSWIYHSLMDLLLKIESSHLQTILIWYHIVPLDLRPQSSPHGDAGDHIDTAEAVHAIHCVLHRSVYAALPTGAVRLHIQHAHSRDSMHATNVDLDSMLSVRMKDTMLPLFAPWLAQDIIQIFYPNGSRLTHNEFSAYVSPLTTELSSAWRADLLGNDA